VISPVIATSARTGRSLKSEPVLFEVARDEIAAGDFEFFAIRVAGDFDDFHAVAQRGRHGVHEVGRGNKDDL
jgi:hypothetical protein